MEDCLESRFAERGSIPKVDSLCMESPPDVYREATRIVGVMLASHARRQRLLDSGGTLDVRGLWENWLAIILSNDQLRSQTPIASLLDDEGLTPDELFVLMTLYVHHTHAYIRDVMTTLRNHIHLSACTPSILVDLLLASNSHHQMDASSLLNFIYRSHLLILRDNFYVKTTEPDVYLHPVILHRFNPDVDLSILDNSYYRIIRPGEGLYVADAVSDEWVSLCRCALKQSGGLRILVNGENGIGKRSLVRYIARRLAVNCVELKTAQWVQNGVKPYKRLFEEMRSFGEIVLIPNVDLLANHSLGASLLNDALEDIGGIFFFTTDRMSQVNQAFISNIHHHLECPKPSESKRRDIWRMYLDHRLWDGVEALSASYLFTPQQIRHAIELAGSYHIEIGSEMSAEILEVACRKVMQQSFDRLAVHTEVEHADLSHLILSGENMQTYQKILSAARNYDKVMLEWGFGERLTTGRGLCILFDGPPGTGKTYAAEVMAHELNRPLQRVDMSSLVSKWIGETGENIARLFAAARSSHAIILLDEADALLSKRSTQSGKSTERYANMEINILLQELERYNGISILTTNLEQVMDDALRRRIQFRISFSEPGVEEREALWRVMLPLKAPIGKNINFNKLAKNYEMSGGHIKNACLNAAYTACHEQSDISERHLIDAANDEYAKLGKLVHNPFNDYDERETWP